MRDSESAVVMLALAVVGAAGFLLGVILTAILWWVS